MSLFWSFAIAILSPKKSNQREQNETWRANKEKSRETKSSSHTAIWYHRDAIGESLPKNRGLFSINFMQVHSNCKLYCRLCRPCPPPPKPSNGKWRINLQFVCCLVTTSVFLSFFSFFKYGRNDMDDLNRSNRRILWRLLLYSYVF